LTAFDVTRIIFSLNDEEDYDEDISYKQWTEFLIENNFKNQKKKGSKICAGNH